MNDTAISTLRGDIFPDARGRYLPLYVRTEPIIPVQSEFGFCVQGNYNISGFQMFQMFSKTKTYVSQQSN